MLVRFISYLTSSDVYEVPDDINEDEIMAEAYDWMNNNAEWGYMIVDENGDEIEKMR